LLPQGTCDFKAPELRVAFTASGDRLQCRHADRQVARQLQRVVYYQGLRPETLLKLAILPPFRSLGTPKFGLPSQSSQGTPALTAPAQSAQTQSKLSAQTQPKLKPPNLSALLPNSCRKPVYNTSGREERLRVCRS